MGIVARQTIKNNILAYVGIGFGVLSQLYIYPLDLELKGVLDTVIKYAQMLLPFTLLGVNAVMIRFLPYSENPAEEAKIQLLTRGLTVVIAVLLAITLFNLLAAEPLFFLLKEQGFLLDKVYNYHWEITWLAGAFGMAVVITTHLINMRRVAIPVIFNNWFLKVGLALIVLAVASDYVVPEYALPAVIAVSWLAVAGLFLYTFRLGALGLKWGNLNLKGVPVKEMFSLAGFSILGSAGGTIAVQLDTLMVNYYLGDKTTAIYTFVVFAALVISIPYKAINSICSPLVAEALKADDIKTIQLLYQQASQVLFAIGGVVFTGTAVCLPFVYELTSRTDQYAIGFVATLLLGVGQLFDQLTSINAVILGASKYFRWNIIFLLVMALANVVLNYYFFAVLGWGLEGAASATMLSLILFNVLKALFIYSKLGVHPLSLSLLYTFCALFIIGVLAYLLPTDSLNPYLSVGFKGAFIVGSFGLYVRFTEGVPPMKKVLDGGLKKLFE
ncbi:MAG: lipopolysaccharide biosynthesis protein [Lewinella sp.]